MLHRRGYSLGHVVALMCVGDCLPTTECAPIAGGRGAINAAPPPGRGSVQSASAPRPKSKPPRRRPGCRLQQPCTSAGTTRHAAVASAAMAPSADGAMAWTTAANAWGNGVPSDSASRNSRARATSLPSQSAGPSVRVPLRGYEGVRTPGFPRRNAAVCGSSGMPKRPIAPRNHVHVPRFADPQQGRVRPVRAVLECPRAHFRRVFVFAQRLAPVGLRCIGRPRGNRVSRGRHPKASRCRISCPYARSAASALRSVWGYAPTSRTRPMRHAGRWRVPHAKDRRSQPRPKRAAHTSWRRVSPARPRSDYYCCFQPSKSPLVAVSIHLKSPLARHCRRFKGGSKACRSIPAPETAGWTLRRGPAGRNRSVACGGQGAKAHVSRGSPLGWELLGRGPPASSPALPWHPP